MVQCDAMSEEHGQTTGAPDAAPPTLPRRPGKQEENCWEQKTESQGAERGLTSLLVTAPGRGPVPASAAQPRRGRQSWAPGRGPSTYQGKSGFFFFFNCFQNRFHVVPK